MSHARLGAVIALTKPRITALLLFVSFSSSLLAARGRPPWERLPWLTAGIWLLAVGSFALNQFLEREVDGRMGRTRGRPLPAGRLRPGTALALGLAASALAVAALAWSGGRAAAALAAATLVSYLLLYTPLKRRTTLHTAVGAVSGGMPVLLGWAGVTGRLDGQAWLLFAVLFLWQIPHFLAIGLLYRGDYAGAGIRVLPAVEPAGRRTWAVLLSAQALLAPLGGLPALTGLVPPAWLPALLAPGAGFLLCGLLARRAQGTPRAPAALRRLVLASVAHLALLFAFLLLGVISGPRPAR